MPVTDTMHHAADHPGPDGPPAAPGPAPAAVPDGAPATAASAGRARRPLTADGADALAGLRAATDLVLDARTLMHRHAADRRGQVLAALEAGVPYRRVAAELDVAVGTVRQLADAARAERDARRAAR